MPRFLTIAAVPDPAERSAFPGVLLLEGRNIKIAAVEYHWHCRGA
jgi:hypothetical protein